MQLLNNDLKKSFLEIIEQKDSTSDSIDLNKIKQFCNLNGFELSSIGKIKNFYLAQLIIEKDPNLFFYLCDADLFKKYPYSYMLLTMPASYENKKIPFYFFIFQNFSTQYICNTLLSHFLDKEEKKLSNREKVKALELKLKEMDHEVDKMLDIDDIIW